MFTKVFKGPYQGLSPKAGFSSKNSCMYLYTPGCVYLCNIFFSLIRYIEYFTCMVQYWYFLSHLVCTWPNCKKKAWLCGDDSPAADLSSSAVWVLSLEFKEDFYAQSCTSWYLIFQVSFPLTVWSRQGHDLTCPWSKQNTIDAIKISHIHYKDHIEDTYLKRLVFGNQDRPDW